MTKYNFNKQFSPAAPFVDLTIRHPVDTNLCVEDVPAQLDTGADVSVIPARFVDQLELLPLEEMTVIGFGGHVLQVSTYLVEMAIRGLPPERLPVISSRDETFVLLGRDLLNQYRVVLDGPGAILEIT